MKRHGLTADKVRHQRLLGGFSVMLSGKRVWWQRYLPRHWPDEMSWLIPTAVGVLLALVALHIAQLLV